MNTTILFKLIYLYPMIIHCLDCGKSVSSKSHSCPYCFSEISELTRELNGLAEKVNFKEKMTELVFGLVHK
jgi:RNA polymerase subunit RPABC4/transcription elongation factor Spt4